MALGLMLGLCLAASFAGAEPRRPTPFLLGGAPPPKKAPVELDPWLPSGAETDALTRPSTTSEAPGCSFRAPVCVHRGKGVRPARAEQALLALEAAYERLVGALGLPAPAPDRRLGGSDALDLYLTLDGSADVAVGVEPFVGRRFDRASGFCVLGNAERALVDRAATICVGEAIALGLDPAETPHLRRAYATHLWLITGWPSSVDVEVIDDLQANPQLAIATRERTRLSEAAAVWFDYLDAARGVGNPGELATSLMSIGVGKTAPRSWLWDNSPDEFDVLRRVLDDSPRDVAMLLNDFAVSRGFMGTRDDGEHPVVMPWLGSFGRQRFDWSIKLSSFPRRVAALQPIEPTGAMYVWVDIDQPTAGMELGFRAEWEPPVSFQWSLVKIGAEGQELGRMNAPFIERGTQVEQNLADLDGVKGLMIVGTNLGGVDLAHPFDPDLAPFEPRGCTVYLTKL